MKLIHYICFASSLFASFFCNICYSCNFIDIVAGVVFVLSWMDPSYFPFLCHDSRRLFEPNAFQFDLLHWVSRIKMCWRLCLHFGAIVNAIQIDTQIHFERGFKRPKNEPVNRISKAFSLFTYSFYSFAVCVFAKLLFHWLHLIPSQWIAKANSSWWLLNRFWFFVFVAKVKTHTQKAL